MASGSQDDRVRRYIARLDRARACLTAELADELEAVRGLTVHDRGRWIASACAATDAILRARKRMGIAADLDEPPASDFAEKWRQLRQRMSSTHERE